MTIALQTASLRQATISFDGEELIADTGTFRRVWRWMGSGFATARIDVPGGPCWHAADTAGCDWLLPICEGCNPPAEIVAVRINESDDEGFTSDHVAAEIEVRYPEVALALRFMVWAYPGAPGLRTQLKIRAQEGFSWDADLARRSVGEEARRVARLDRGWCLLDILPVDPARATRRWFGYHSDTQNRNDVFLDLLKEHVDERPLLGANVCDWANAGCCERAGWGLALLKESHQTVNQRGRDTGAFICVPGDRLENRGWGVLASEIDEQWRPAWATWCIAYADDDHSRQLAFKTFDRLRYPVRPGSIHLQSNTWGSSQGPLEHREAASEASVLREMESCVDLGVELLQIDDGWQGNDHKQWHPDPQRYPAGWSTVRAAAAARGLKLGLWLAAIPCSAEDLRRNADEGGFVSFKLDFAQLNRREVIDRLMHKVRTFVKSRDHKVLVNWDLTELAPRYGYFFAREFGNIYLENRKPVIPRSTTYRPATVLRDLWYLATYCNLFKFQGSCQNLDMVDPLYSDAAAYRHDYCLAITLMSSPLFFCETRFYSQEARDQLRPLIEAYKAVRDELITGIVSPIGEPPDGTRHTGFICELPDARAGFMMLFREPANDQAQAVFTLPQLTGRKLVLTDLLRDTTTPAIVEADHRLEIAMPEAGDFRFLRWSLTD